MAHISHHSGLDQRPPLEQRTFVTVADEQDTGTLWERTEGRVVEKSLVSSYAKVNDIEHCWLFTRMFQKPQYVQASSLQLACLRFLQAIGVQGHIRIQEGSAENNSL